VSGWCEIGGRVITEASSGLMIGMSTGPLPMAMCDDEENENGNILFMLFSYLNFMSVSKNDSRKISITLITVHNQIKQVAVRTV
jgi:hypothetical protein